MNLQADKKEKKDAVIEALTEKLYDQEDKVPKDLIRFFLFANPKGSQLSDTTNPEKNVLLPDMYVLREAIKVCASLEAETQYKTSERELRELSNAYAHLTDNIQSINSVSEEKDLDKFYPKLPLKSVSLPVRIRHVITSYLDRLDALYFMKIKLLLDSYRGGDGKITYGTGEVKETFTGLNFISVKSQIRKALVDELPTLIDLCYSIKYGSSGSFSYSLSEVKPFKVDTEFMDACLKYVSSKIMDNDQIFTEQAFAQQYVDDWMQTYTSKLGNEKYPPQFVKMAKAIVARVGKFYFMKPSKLEEVRSEAELLTLQNNIKNLFVMLTADLDKTNLDLSNKKVYQTTFYNGILASLKKVVPPVLTGTQSNALALYQIFMSFMGTLIGLSDSLYINRGVIFLDFNGINKNQFDSSNFFLNPEGHNGAYFANDRFLNAVYKFISVESQYEDYLANRPISSRKRIPDTINNSLVKFEASFKDRQLKDAGFRFKEEAAENPFDYGYLQKGVMTINSAVTLPDKTNHDFALFSYLVIQANILDNYADIYSNRFTPEINKRKVELTKMGKSTAVTASLAGGTFVAGPNLNGVHSGQVTQTSEANLPVFLNGGRNQLSPHQHQQPVVAHLTSQQHQPPVVDQQINSLFHQPAHQHQPSVDSLFNQPPVVDQQQLDSLFHQPAHQHQPSVDSLSHQPANQQQLDSLFHQPPVVDQQINSLFHQPANQQQLDSLFNQQSGGGRSSPKINNAGMNSGVASGSGTGDQLGILGRTSPKQNSSVSSVSPVGLNVFNGSK